MYIRHENSQDKLLNWCRWASSCLVCFCPLLRGSAGHTVGWCCSNQSYQLVTS